AILTARDCSSSGGHPEEQQLPFFKVVILTIDVNMMQYNLQTISSANEPGWKISFGSLKNKSPSIYMVLRQHNAVVCRGMAHWLFWSTSGLYTLDVDARTDHVSFTNLLDMGRIDNYFGPPTYDAPYLAVNGKGRLMLVYLNKGGYRLEICTSHNNGRWHHALTRKLKQPNQKKNEKKTQGKVLYTCLGEKNGTLIIKDNHHDAYVIDINMGVVQEVIDSPHTRRLNREKTVPFEMDWPAFFVSQLAVVPTW
uniref:F-box associated domain-containing protein n=2 Tax=Aegilops tauschii TaxID=37682 RepID=A0A453A3H7_AEGTS